MEKNRLRIVTDVVILCFFLLLPFQSAFSQLPTPSHWEEFVSDPKRNTLVMDTFLFQSFEQNAADTWGYTMEGSAERIDVSKEYGIKGQGGSYSLILPPASKVVFETFDVPSAYKQVYINAGLAAKELKKEDVFQVEAFRDNKENKWDWYKPAKENESFSYRQSLHYNGAVSNPVNIPKNPSNIRLITPDTNTGAFFCIDSVYAFGQIEQYTLFSGQGEWSDTALWSHLPAMRHRRALVKGQASVTSAVTCEELHVSEGSVRVERGASLSTGNVLLYYPDYEKVEVQNIARIELEGNLSIASRVTISKAFPEKGKWYFISFPFDVYPNGLDSYMKWADDTNNKSGKFFYVCSYNGDRRAANGHTGNSWEVMKVSASDASRPVFEKGKGYLIALDAGATFDPLRFTSSVGKLPDDFGKSISIPVQAPQAGSREEDNGWCLCGNPLPDYLPLSCIRPNPALDGYVYVYEEGGYKSYAIGSNYALPPLSAFFVKARKDTELTFPAVRSLSGHTLLSCRAPLSQTGLEPVAEPKPTHAELLPGGSGLTCFLDGDGVCVGNMPAAGSVQVYDLSGTMLRECTVGCGSSRISFAGKPGLYILKVKVGDRTFFFKSVKRY